jgi:beta-barrel assembly-enhancing protease
MKTAAIALATLLVAAPGYAQLGGLSKKIGQAKDAKEKADKVADLKMSDKEERQLGEKISELLVQRFGVYQDAAVTKYVSLVGSVLAQASDRPKLDWQFVVLDTDGVNAYAAPGGFIHITRGALGLIKNEAELAGVLGHEITHVTEKHTVKAIEKAKRVDFAADTAGGSGLTGEIINKLANVGFEVLFENRYDRGDELEADRVGIALANKVGYAPSGMISVLEKITLRNKDTKEPNGWFASHPQTKERIEKMQDVIKKDKLNATATVQARYAKTIAFDVKAGSAIAMDIAGVKGAVGDTAAPKEEKKEEKKRGGVLGKVNLTSKSESQNTQTVASAGSRGGVPDRDAVGGPNKTKLRVTISASEVDAFKKGIAG